MITAGPKALAVLHRNQIGQPWFELLDPASTHLTAPPVYSTAKSSSTNNMNPNPRGANGVKRFSVRDKRRQSARIRQMRADDPGLTLGSKHQDRQHQSSGNEHFHE